MSILKKTIAGALTIVLSVGAIGTSAMPVLAASENNIDVLQKNVEKAQEAYDKAETDYDNGAIEFLESKMCDKHKETLNYKQYLNNIQNATGKNAEELHNAMEKREKEFTTADGKEDIQKKKSYAKGWISFDNLRLQSKYLDELNQKRKEDKNEQSIKALKKDYSNEPLKINPELVMDSMMSSMVGYYTDNWHVLGHSSVTHKEWWGFNENQAFTNLSPLEEWYDEELSLFNKGERNIEEIGHYLNCMCGGGKDITGFGFYNGKYATKKFSFSTMRCSSIDSNENSYTSDEWLKMVNEAEAPLKKNLDEAKANLDAAKKALKEATKPDFANADAAREKANKLNKGDYTEKTWNAVETALNELNKAYQNENLTQEDLDKVVANLNAAMNKLEKKPVNPKPEPSKPEPEKPKEDVAVNKIVLSASKYTYNGKTHTPSVKVYDQKGKMLSADQYAVTYSSGRKNLGSYTVDVYGKGDVTGTASAKYVITPAKMKTPSVKAGKKKLTVKWKKLGGGSQNYQIYVLKKGTKKAKYYTSTGSSKTIKKLSKKKYYYTKIRSYKKINGKTYYGSWSGTKKVKVK